MPQRLADRGQGAAGRGLAVYFYDSRAVGTADLAIRDGRLVVVAEKAWSSELTDEFLPPHARVQRVTEIELDWDRRTGQDTFAGEVWDQQKENSRRVWARESTLALFSGCAGASGPLPRHPYLFRRGISEQVRPEDIDLRVGVVDTSSAPLRLRIQLADDHSIPAVDGSAAALQAADHLVLWTNAPGATSDDDAENPHWGWLIGRGVNDQWHVAGHPGSQDPPAIVTVQRTQGELWIDVAWDSMEAWESTKQKDAWFRWVSSSLAVVVVDVDEKGKAPEAMVSTGTLHDGRPALTQLARCVPPGPYPTENYFVKIRVL